MDQTEIQKQTMTIRDQVSALKIQGPGEYVKAGELWNVIRDIRKGWHDSMKPVVSKAFEAHKAAKAVFSQYDTPLETDQKTLKRGMIDWDQEQERERQRKQLEAEAVEKKRAEEENLEVASLMESVGLNDEAEELLDRPVETQAVVLPKTTPKVEGLSSRLAWKAKCTDLRALATAALAGEIPLESIQPNDLLLGQQARSLKQGMHYPGVSVWSERV